MRDFMSVAPTENVDDIDLATASQATLELLYSKYQQMRCIKYEISDGEIPQELTQAGIPLAFGLDLIAQMLLHRRCKFDVLAGLLHHHFIHDEHPAKACAEMITKAVNNDFVHWHDQHEIFIMAIDIPDEVKERMGIFQYPLPMIEEPETVKNNRETGYQTIRNSILLRDNHHEEDVCLDHINRANGIPLRLNEDVVALVQNHWKNIDKIKPGESRSEFKQRQKNFRTYDQVSRDVIDALLAQGNHFWLTHRYDKRGRTYASGYHVNYQGNDWNKACVELAEAEPLNEE